MNKKIKIIFLSYHYLKRQDEFNRIWGCDFKLFKEHVGFLEKYYKPVGLAELDAFLNGDDVELPKKCSILIFDDGLKEHAEVIAPYLAERKIRALFNINTCIFDKEPASTQVIHCGTAYYGIGKFYGLIEKYCDIIGINKKDYELFNPKDNRQTNILVLNKRIKAFFKTGIDYYLGRKILLEIWHKELEKDNKDIFTKIYLTKKDLHELTAMDHEIGAHTHTHILVSDENCTDEIFAQEITGSVNRLKNLLQREVRCFAYPFGQQKEIFYDSKKIEKLHDIGLRYIFTTFRATDNFNKDFIGRYSVGSTETILDLKKNIWEYEINKK